MDDPPPVAPQVSPSHCNSRPRRNHIADLPWAGGDGGNRHPGPRAIPRFTPRTPGASIARPLARTRDRKRAASGGTMRRHMERQDPPPLVRPLHAPARISDANAVQRTSAATPVALPRINNLRHRVPRRETRLAEAVLAVILTSVAGPALPQPRLLPGNGGYRLSEHPCHPRACPDRSAGAGGQSPLPHELRAPHR